MSTTAKLPSSSQRNLQISQYRKRLALLPVKSLRMPDLICSSELESYVPIDNIPILVMCEKPNSYSVIDGCKRLRNAIGQDIETIECLIIDQALSEQDSGLLRISLNKTRQFSFHEKIEISKWLLARFGQEGFQEALTACGIPDKDFVGASKICSLDEQIIEAVSKGFVDETNAVEMQRMNGDQREALLSLFSQLKFSKQAQRELLEWLPEIAFLNKRTVYDIVHEDALQEVLKHPKLNDPQKIQKIRDHLFATRFPYYSQTLVAWQKAAAKVNPSSSNVHFNHSPGFEKNWLEIKINVTSAQKACDILKKLSEISPESWDSLINPM